MTATEVKARVKEHASEMKNPLAEYPVDQTLSGLRYDAGKLRMDLLPPEWFEHLAAVLTKGAVKYEPRNWEKGMPWSKVAGPLLRHYLAFLKGEERDKESGELHTAHIAVNALFLLVYQLRGLGVDDVTQRKT